MKIQEITPEAVNVAKEILGQRSSALSIYNLAEPTPYLENVKCETVPSENGGSYLRFNIPGIPNPVSASLMPGTKPKADESYDIVIVKAKRTDEKRGITVGLRAFRAVGAN